MENLSNEELASLQVAAEKATPGPWYATYSLGVTVWSDNPVGGYAVADGLDEEDATFIIAANPETVKRMARELAALRSTPAAPVASEAGLLPGTEAAERFIGDIARKVVARLRAKADADLVDNGAHWTEIERNWTDWMNDGLTQLTATQQPAAAPAPGEAVTEVVTLGDPEDGYTLDVSFSENLHKGTQEPMMVAQIYDGEDGLIGGCWFTRSKAEHLYTLLGEFLTSASTPPAKRQPWTGITHWMPLPSAPQPQTQKGGGPDA